MFDVRCYSDLSDSVDGPLSVIEIRDYYEMMVIGHYFGHGSCIMHHTVMAMPNAVISSEQIRTRYLGLVGRCGLLGCGVCRHNYLFFRGGE